MLGSKVMQDTTAYSAVPARTVVPPAADIAGSVRMADFKEHLRREAQGSEAAHEFVPDAEYEASDGIRESLAAIRSGAPIVFISGRAGTGKSRLIDYMKSMPGGAHQAVVAPTGVAALSLRAVTVHSYFRLPVGVINSDALDNDVKFDPSIRHIRRLVIDEISMVRADVLDAIDQRLRHLQTPSLPFGGVQVIMVGDFLQLPPVVTSEDRELLARLRYETPFAFSSRVMQENPIRVATLKKVWRQVDPAMIEALGSIREGRNVAQAIDWLNDRCVGPHRSGKTPLLLTATRSAADNHNQAGISELRSKLNGGQPDLIFQARSEGSFECPRATLPAPRRLALLPGARVMAVRNDPGGAFVNGSLGQVIEMNDGAGDLEDAYVSVKFDGSDNVIRIFAARWTSARQIWSEVDGSISDEVTGAFCQIPLTMGHAITIHKSQGLTLEDVRIDLGRGAFAPGQLYVALSRAKSIEGLSLAQPISMRDVRVDEMLVKFLDWARSANNMDFEASPSRVEHVSV